MTKTLPFPPRRILRGFVAILIVCVIILVSFYVIRRISPLLFPPACAGYIDPSQRYCSDQGQMISGQSIPESTCNPINPTFKQQLQLEFLAYLRRIQSSIRPTLETSIRQAVETNNGEGAGTTIDVYQGYMLFSIPPLLKILPSDFGQNEITPYGVMSFFPTYLLRCLWTDTDNTSADVCELLFPQASSIVQDICKDWIDAFTPSTQNMCPFDVNVGNPSLRIDDPRFFHLVGTLGAFSMNHSQGTILFVNLPVASLNVDYWSFTLYLGDRLRQDDTCTPYRQTYFASLASPLSAYNVPAVAGKRLNALRGTGDVVEQGHIRGYIVLALNPTIAQLLMDVASSRNDADFVYWMQIPTEMVIDPTLPNPNGLTTDDLMYDPSTDRLSLFLRLSPAKDASSEERDRLRRFVEYEPPFDTSAVDLCFVDFGDNAMNEQRHVVVEGTESYVLRPLTIMPPHPEPYDDAFRGIWTMWQRRIRNETYRSNYITTPLATRHTLLNVFSPFTRKILQTTTIPYEGGWQAIQMAGCAQGDNPDAIYRLSEGVCLGEDDVMVAMCVNHAKESNCVYNNINVLDLNKAFSFASISLNRASSATFYVVLASRNQDRLANVETLLRNASSFLPYNVDIHPVYIPTGTTSEDGVPMCHQIMMVERIYVNTSYPSLTTPSQTYSLYDVFGETLRTVQNLEDEDRWNSLLNVTAPNVNGLIPPYYVKVSYPSRRRQVLYASMATLVVVMTYGVYGIWRATLAQRTKRMSFKSG